MDSVEALVLAMNVGFDVREVPADMRGRTGGAPSTRGWKLAYYYARLLVVLVTSYTRPATDERRRTGVGATPVSRRARRASRMSFRGPHLHLHPRRIATLLFILRLVRRHRLRAKYSVLWVSLGAALALVAAAPVLLEGISDLLGIKTPVLTFLLMAIDVPARALAALLLGAVAAGGSDAGARRGVRAAARRIEEVEATIRPTGSDVMPHRRVGRSARVDARPRRSGRRRRTAHRAAPRCARTRACARAAGRERSRRAADPGAA